MVTVWHYEASQGRHKMNNSLGLVYPNTFYEIDELPNERLLLLWQDLPPALTVRHQAMITKIRIVLEGRGIDVRK